MSLRAVCVGEIYTSREGVYCRDVRLKRNEFHCWKRRERIEVCVFEVLQPRVYMFTGLSRLLLCLLFLKEHVFNRLPMMSIYQICSRFHGANI